MLIENLEVPENLKIKIEKKLKKEKITLVGYILSLIDNDLNTTINLGNGFSYNEYLDKFYNSDDSEIKLTRLQKKLLKELIKNNGEIESAEDLIKKVWKRDDVSIFTFRNMINQIRHKTYYELIKNYSNRGYSINI